jgi:thermostable 8-oxoguanine DNA glycosylase
MDTACECTLALAQCKETDKPLYLKAWHKNICEVFSHNLAIILKYKDGRNTQASDTSTRVYLEISLCIVTASMGVVSTQGDP